MLGRVLWVTGHRSVVWWVTWVMGHKIWPLSLSALMDRTRLTHTCLVTNASILLS